MKQTTLLNRGRCAALLVFGVLNLQTAVAQPALYPAFTANVYDTTVTGYYFLCPILTTTLPQYNLILDAKGKVIYTQKPSKGNFSLLPNGMMGTDYQTVYRVMDSTFAPVDTIKTVNGITWDGHDVRLLPNGHWLMLGLETVSMDLSSYDVFNHNGSPGSATANVKCTVIQEQDANGNVVFEWHARNYFSFLDVDTSFLSSPTTVDWTHSNALEVDTDGNILLSTRHFDEITKINRSDSSIIWRMGGNQNQFTFVNDTQMFRGQHDIRRISNGHLTLFDNGGSLTHPATAKEYLINESTLTATLVWSYVEDSAKYSNAMGNVQRLANGNTLVDFGFTPNYNNVFSVVDSMGAKIFDISFDSSYASYRSFYYPALPFQLPRPQISCYYDSLQFYLDAGAGYASYRWSNGETTQRIPVTMADTFSVFVQLSPGEYISSQDYIVNNTLSPCLNVSIENMNGNSRYMVYPNPSADGIFNIKFADSNNLPQRIYIVSATGKKIIEENYSGNAINHIINLKSCAPGIYFLVMENEKGRRVTKLVR